MIETLFSYPHHLQRLGPITLDTFEAQTILLTGAHLDYYYLLATEEFPTIAIEFLPDGPPHRVRVQTNSGLVAYKRSVDELIMRETIKSKFGTQVELFRLRIGNSD